MTGFFALECHFGLTFTSEEYMIFFVQESNTSPYETLRKTFLALPRPKMLPYTPSSENSKSWHSTSDIHPCKSVGVHPCQLSEFDPIKDQSLLLRQKIPPGLGNLWNGPYSNRFNYYLSTVQNFSTIFDCYACTDARSDAFCIQMFMNKVALAKLEWHNKIAIILPLY